MFYAIRLLFHKLKIKYKWKTDFRLVYGCVNAIELSSCSTRLAVFAYMLHALESSVTHSQSQATRSRILLWTLDRRRRLFK